MRQLIEDSTIIYGCFCARGGHAGGAMVFCQPASLAHLYVWNDPRQHPPGWPDQMPAYERAIEVYDHILALGGLTTLAEVVRVTGLPTAEAQDALRDLYGRGLVTNISPAYALDGHQAEVGQWVSCLSLRDAAAPKPLDEDEKARRKVLGALRMFGIASIAVLASHFRGLFARRCNTLNAAEIRRACEQLVGRGEAIKGFFVRDLEGEQYALPGLPEQARAGKSAGGEAPMVMISSMDPASLHVSVIPVPTPNAYCFPTRFMVLDRGRLAAVIDQKSGAKHRFVANNVHLPEAMEPKDVCRLIDAVADFLRCGGRCHTLEVQRIEGRPAAGEPMAAAFRHRGFEARGTRLVVSLDAMRPWVPDSLPQFEASDAPGAGSDRLVILQTVLQQVSGVPVARQRNVGRTVLKVKGRVLLSCSDGEDPGLGLPDGSYVIIPRALQRYAHIRKPNIWVGPCVEVRLPPEVDLQGAEFRRLAKLYMDNVMRGLQELARRRRRKKT